MKLGISLFSIILMLASCSNNSVLISEKKNQTSSQNLPSPFLHGVASGDPLQDRVIIWTRVTSVKEVEHVKWEISETENFSIIVQSGIVSTDETRDYTVKVDVPQLLPGTTYYYRFYAQTIVSPIGKTKTLPEGDTENINLGIVSCSNYEFGYFNAYDGLVAEDVDAVLHLGDYIYEYGPGTYGDTAFVRKHLPAKEILTIEDYRTRYAQYRTDESLQKAHQMLPFIMIWDDHEIANNAFATGAQNHQENEGIYEERKAIARQAYYEWQPIRDTKQKEHYRKFQFGDLAEIFMLDERFTGRVAPPETTEEAASERTMLGSTQLGWFKKGLKKSSAKWKIIGNQVIFSPCDLSLVRPSSPMNFDAWDGYAAERDGIIDFLNVQFITNTIFVTGDTHASWAFEVPADYSTYKNDPVACAIEIATPSITSSNWNDSGTSDEDVMKAEKALLYSNPHLSYVNGRDHGFTILKLSKDNAIAKWYYTSDIKIKKAEITMAHSQIIPASKLKLERVSQPLAIIDVSVIPMTGKGIVLQNQTVILENGKIKSIGRSTPDNAEIINGKGKFLIPGLTEMHAHIPIPEDGNDINVKETLFLYLSQGVTTIRGMLGNPYHLELKDMISRDEILSPRVYTSSPSMNGNSVPSAEVARKKVTQYKRDGYDFLKIHPGIQLHVWEELERTANEVGIPYSGHVPVDVGIRRALKSGYGTVDHLDGYLEGLVPDDLNVDPNTNGFFGYNFTDIAETMLIKELVRMTLDNGVAIVPTQTLFTRWFSPTDAATMMTEPEMKYMSSQTRFAWRQNKTRILSDSSYSSDQWERFIAIRKAVLRAMDKAGVTFLLGSDAPQVMNVPGFSVHHEMKDMADSGISNYKILESATLGPAQFFGAKGEYGVIKEGASADLILLNANPLENISNAAKIESVFVRGKHLTRKAIADRLATIAERHKGEE